MRLSVATTWRPCDSYVEEAVSTPYWDVVSTRQLECGQAGSFAIGRRTHRSRRADINYRANIYAMHLLGVTHIIGLSSVAQCTTH
jgi:purine nucleoside phosphorylase